MEERGGRDRRRRGEEKRPNDERSLSLLVYCIIRTPRKECGPAVVGRAATPKTKAWKVGLGLRRRGRLCAD